MFSGGPCLSASPTSLRTDTRYCGQALPPYILPVPVPGWSRGQRIVWEPHPLEEFRERSGLFVSRGMEVSTDMGHMIVIGLDRYVAGIRRAVELRHVLDEVGGFMIVAHPFRHFFDPIHFRRDGRPPFEMTPDEAAERMPVFKLVDEIEVANGGSTPRENQFALKVTKALGKQGIGASDCHSTQGVGYYVTVFEEELRDQEQMLEQLRARRFHAAEG